MDIAVIWFKPNELFIKFYKYFNISKKLEDIEEDLRINEGWLNIKVWTKYANLEGFSSLFNFMVFNCRDNHFPFYIEYECKRE